MLDVPFPYDDMVALALALKDAGTGIPVITQYGTSGIYLPKFGNGDNDLLTFAWQLPHSYKIGSDIYPHVHWLASGGQAGNVGWQMTYQWVNDAGAFNSAASTTPAAVVTAYANIAQDTHIYTALATIDGHTVPKGMSSILVGTLNRPTQGANEFDGDVFLLAFDAHIQKSISGSRQETTQ